MPSASLPIVGIIGMGGMGRMYTNRLAQESGYQLIVCDRPELFDSLKLDYEALCNVKVVLDGHLVSRESDFIIYCVDAENLESIVAQYGPSTKAGAVVAGQTSVKAPEQIAFEKYLPSNTKICSVHSLHGPSLIPDDQTLIIIPHRCTEEDKKLVMRILEPLRSRYVELSYHEHDKAMANTQACTHAAFLSMGSAWHAHGYFPWESGRYIGGIEVAKINVTLRIYSSIWHVYAGLAIMNPEAKTQIHQFSRSVTELFILMISNDEKGLRDRVYAARDYVFGPPDAPNPLSPPVFVSEDIFSEFAIGEPADAPSPPNSHLTLLAIVDCWYQVKLNPLVHLELAATPIFRLWFGIIQYLFTSPKRLNDAIHASLNNFDFRGDDCEYVVAARGWSQCVSHGSFHLYRERFEATAKFFGPRLREGIVKSNAMLKFMLDN
ncbi:hypothetical protein PPACK8108_LOCUS19219 [Phakopsora pachyrhizi]|uniref:Prephenate/arogenate dehydrogenase domain-containing protein n=1 Tax=Phakopsora pachyrhizi TaxID=170000 RepID=A0AAV0BBW3_PHAPC|nr:hypothetical protein PPACK8108_LOCUS19219 [Phakopsora pachyrhizi]